MRLLAEQACTTTTDAPFIVPVLDAQRSGVFAAAYAPRTGGLEATKETSVVPIDDFANFLPDDAVLTGHGVERLRRVGARDSSHNQRGLLDSFRCPVSSTG